MIFVIPSDHIPKNLPYHYLHEDSLGSLFNFYLKYSFILKYKNTNFMQ